MENRTKYLLMGFGVIALGTGGYFLYKHFSKTGSQSATDDFKEALEDHKIPAPSLPAPKPKAPSGYKPKPATTTFPLILHSKGSLVKSVQTALMKKYPGVLPKYKDDGYYGTELQDTLVSKGLSTIIDKELYDKILAGKVGTDPKGADNKTNSTDAKLGHESIADLLYSGIAQKNIDTCLRALWKIKNVQQYIQVNEVFKTKRIDGGVRKTVATALSHAFPSDPNRKKYRAQLYTIGLKWRNEQWALAGTIGQIENRLVTIKSSKIWDNSGNSFPVPTATIIGSFISAKNGLTEFLTLDGRHLFIDTTSIQYHHD